jgi:hypothetical protein
MTKETKKLSMEEMIKKLDDAKKTNPLDLSSDQDLSIALMNLVSIEEHFFFSGVKTGKVSFYDMINVVRDMRKDLMLKIVKNNSVDGGEVWCISKHLLAASMRLKEVGDKANAQGKKKEAADLYAKAYDLYSLFWGINMELIDMADVKKADAEILPYTAKNETRNAKREVAAATAGDKSVTSRLGSWVKNTINCCVE